MRSFLKSFWEKYEERYHLYAGITAGIFLLQIVHLYWLTTHVVTFRLFGLTLFDPGAFWQFVIIVVDYLEIPAIISTSILYLYSLNKKWNVKDFVLLVLLNTQWLHLFWISDEFVLDTLRHESTSTVLPYWLAWIAIAIDYLELPVMVDTTKKFIVSLRKRENSTDNSENKGNS